ncbi:Ppx/GppA phosphatase family protein [Alteribacter populi]|uniref:Ppx/GppA phosphatase family protein n=1 Tax=Alteribacter populi TaxID=2011011 RepID=UPI000BBA4A86|nr:Ppx/GppA phosphatase family protein [Alteribacter populi]
MKKQTAVIDLGSNSIRLVIFEIDNQGGYKEIENLKIVARLSSHIDEAGCLSAEGLATMKETLCRFRAVMEQYTITEVRGVATAAIRNAVNREEIEHFLEEETDMSFRVLSEKEEACYGFLAVANSTEVADGITIDIGGGSTEITLFKNRDLKHYHSFPFGALTLKRRFVEDGDRPTDTELRQLRKFVHDAFDTLPWLKSTNDPVIGIGGSARNIALVHQHSIDYPLAGLHHYEMNKKDVSAIFDKLYDITLKQRQQVDGLSKDRADIILPAICVIETLLDYINTERFILSNKGLREGVFFETLLTEMKTDIFPNVTEESFYQLSKEYQLDGEHHRKLSVLAATLFHWLKAYSEQSYNDEDLHLLTLAARVFYIGESIHPEARSQHTFYLLTNQSIDGLSHLKRLAVALLASFRSRSLFYQFAKPFNHWVADHELKKYEQLGAILRLAYGLNRTKQSVVTDVKVVSKKTNHLSLHINTEKDAYFEEVHAQKYKKHLERAFNIDIDVSINKEKASYSDV